MQSHPMQQHSDFEPLMDWEKLPGEQVQAAEEWTVDMAADLLQVPEWWWRVVDIRMRDFVLAIGAARASQHGRLNS